jgi:hypothetical protein
VESTRDSACSPAVPTAAQLIPPARCRATTQTTPRGPGPRELLAARARLSDPPAARTRPAACDPRIDKPPPPHVVERGSGIWHGSGWLHASDDPGLDGRPGLALSCVTPRDMLAHGVPAREESCDPLARCIPCHVVVADEWVQVQDASKNSQAGKRLRKCLSRTQDVVAKSH